MLLTVDIGNTNITLGVFDGKKLKTTFRMTTIQTRTSDEYGMVICELLFHNEVKVSDITDAIVASVVPNVMHSLTNAILKYFHTRPIIIEAGIKTGIRVAGRNPRQVGADRIVDAAAVYELYGGPSIVVDYGTATTFDLVDEDGTFTACVIAPGIRTSAQSMWSMAAKLPEFEIKKPKSILAQDTIACMQAGLVYGQVGQTEYIIRQMKKEFGREDVKVVATGGLGRIIEKETDVIDIYDPQLTLYGMRLIFEKQKK
ncbi:MAG: type III pantothenate kinase [Clostridiales bacterium]|nr:type III pantothenate kinase [Clostridiales bacterium]MCD8218590.1 type III pantothenate kinase [Clostridiales bacterium]